MHFIADSTYVFWRRVCSTWNIFTFSLFNGNLFLLFDSNFFSFVSVFRLRIQCFYYSYTEQQGKSKKIFYFHSKLSKLNRLVPRLLLFTFSVIPLSINNQTNQWWKLIHSWPFITGIRVFKQTNSTYINNISTAYELHTCRSSTWIFLLKFWNYICSTSDWSHKTYKFSKCLSILDWVIYIFYKYQSYYQVYKENDQVN